MDFDIGRKKRLAIFMSKPFLSSNIVTNSTMYHVREYPNIIRRERLPKVDLTSCSLRAKLCDLKLR